jgi:hypothetical protein
MSVEWVSIVFVWHIAADLILFIVALLAVKTAAVRNRKVSSVFHKFTSTSMLGILFYCEKILRIFCILLNIYDKYIKNVISRFNVVFQIIVL